MNIVIRSAKESDYEEVIKLYGIFVESDRFSDRKSDGFKKVLSSPTSFLWVAVDENAIVGFAMLSIRDVVRYARPIAELDELFVLQEWRKQGVGKRLVLEAEGKARELNCQRLYLESGAQRTPAHAFYEGLGYEKYGFAFKKEL